MTFATIGLMAPVVFVAYTIFGLTGFGAAMMAVPILVQLVPLQFAVPLVVLFDLVCTTIVGVRNRRSVSKPELARLFPGLVVGVVIGTTTLDHVAPRWPLIALGVFVIVVSIRNLTASAQAAKAPIAAWWSMPFGVVGGIFSALFGTGGPIYTIYLSRRLDDLDAFRATISVLILLSGISRAIAFGSAGLYARDDILVTAAVLVPVSLAGVFAGSRLRARVDPHLLKRVVFVLLAIAGVGALYRGLTSPA
jgi:uncharacterized membrane protein YfcA